MVSYVSRGFPVTWSGNEIFMRFLILFHLCILSLTNQSIQTDNENEYPCQIEEESRQPHKFICDLNHHLVSSDSLFSPSIASQHDISSSFSSSSSTTSSTLKVVTHNTLFIVINNTLLYSRSILDRESLHRGAQCDTNAWQQRREVCIVLVEVADMRNSQNPRFFEIPVVVTDINDHSPDFRRQSLFTAQVQENEPANTLMDLPTATDPDRGNNGTLNYKIEGDGSNRFRLVSNTRNGRLQLKTLQSFDREKNSEFHFQLIAEDAGTPVARSTSLSLIVQITEVNEDSPVFSQSIYEIHIPENMSVSSVVKQVIATDADKDSYVMISSPPTPGPSRLGQTFNIDSEGRVTLRRPLDYEDPEDRFFEIPLQAIDTGQPPKTGTALLKVFVTDINDEAPKIEIRSLKPNRGSSSFSVLENAPVNAFVAKVSVSDADSGQYGQVECRLEQGSMEFILHQTSLANSNSLSMGKNKQDYQLLTALSFDREVKEHYSVTIICSDRAPPDQRLFTPRDFSVLIEDVNDNGPTFLHSLEMEKLLENQPIGTQITRLNTRDLDQGENAITHYEIPEAYAHIVEVNRFTGVVLTKQVFDREINRTIHFQAVAFDSKNASMRSTVNYTVQILDENDNAPVMKDDFHFTISEGHTVQIGQVTATDADEGMNAKITFHLSDAYPQRHLWTVHSNGFISVASGSHLDREIQGSYRVPIVACDGGRPSLSTTTTVTIEVLDVNDCSPIFQEPPHGHGSFNISRKSIPGTVVYRLKALDKDAGENARIRYFLRNLDSSNPSQQDKNSIFHVDSDSGDITLNQIPNGDYRFPRKLIITAEDHGEPRRSSTAFLDVTLVSDEIKPYNRDENGEALSGSLVDSRGVPLEHSPDASQMEGTTWTKKMLIVLMVAFIGLLVILIVATLLYFLFNCGQTDTTDSHQTHIKRRENQTDADQMTSWLPLWCGACRELMQLRHGSNDRTSKENVYSSATGSNVPLAGDIATTRGIVLEDVRERGQLLQRLPSSGYEAISGGGSMYQCMHSDQNSSTDAFYPQHHNTQLPLLKTTTPTKRSFPTNMSNMCENIDNYWSCNVNDVPPHSYDVARGGVGGDVWSEKVMITQNTGGLRPPQSKQINSTNSMDGSNHITTAYGYTPSGDTLHSATSDEVRGIFYSSSNAPSQPTLASQRHAVPRHLFGGSSGIIGSNCSSSQMLMPSNPRSHSLNHNNSLSTSVHPTRQQSQNLVGGVGLINCYLKSIAASSEALPVVTNEKDNTSTSEINSNVISHPPIYSTYGTTGRALRIPTEENRMQHVLSTQPSQIDSYNSECGTGDNDGFLSRSGYVKGAPCYSSSFV